MAKKKDESTASISRSDDASSLRRSARGTPTRNQATKSPLNTRKSERFEKQTSPNPSLVKKKSETQMGLSPLRRSDRGKKLVGVADIPNIKSTDEKTSNSSKQRAGDVNGDIKNTRQDPDVGDRKRKRFAAHRYKSFQPQRIRVVIDVENPEGREKSPQTNTSNNKGTPDKDQKALLVESCMDSEHVGCPSQTKPLDGKSTGSGNVKAQISGSCSPSNRNIADSDNQISHTSSSRINHNLENQQELDSCDKVIGTCKAASVMDNAENNDTTTNIQNSKFVEFWVPVQISNMQLEQYCATLLSNAMILRSCSKTDTLGALKEILITNMKCCNHPYLVDPFLEKFIMKDYEQSMQLDVGIKTSGKLQFLDLILPEVQRRQLRVLILFQSTSGTSIGNILDDFVHRRFGQDSYVRVDGFGPISSTNKAALNKFNKEMSRFILLLESRACHPSITLSSVDLIIIYDSDLIPANDLRGLQKVHIDSNSEQIMSIRLYSSSTLEEKVLKLAEQNVAIGIRSQSLRSNYDALLTWGVSNLFQRLNEFHASSDRNVSSEDSLSRDVMEELLYLISHKCKSKDTAKLIITRVQNFGTYGKNIPLHSEIKSHLPDGDQPHIFWRKVFEGQNPLWKFLPESIPRQRKRPNYFLGSPEEISTVKGGVKSRRRTVNGQLKPVNEGEVGGINEGGSGIPAHNESRSSSGDQFWSTAVVNEASIHDLLKPTVFELCNVLKFTEDVKITVERFLEFVLENFRVGKEHTSTLQAFMISLCWIGSALAKNDIDRSKSFAIAKKHFNFSCMEDETEEVYKRLERAKEKFLQHTEIFDALKDCVTKNLDVSECNESSNEKEANKCKKQMEDVSRKDQEEIEKYNREWEKERVNLVNDYSVDEALIRFLHSSNPSVMSEKMKILDQEFAKKLGEHERMRESHLRDLESTLLAREGQVAADNELYVHQYQHEIHIRPSGNPEVCPTLAGNEIEAQSHDQPVHDIGTSIPIMIEGDGADESSHTSEKQMADATSSSVSVGEIQDQQHDHMEHDVAGADVIVVSEQIGEFPAQQNDDVTNDVAGKVTLVETEVPEVNTSQQHAVEDGNEIGPIDMAPHGDSCETGMPTGNRNEENVEEMLTISPTTSHAVEDGNETSPHDVERLVDSGEMPRPSGNEEKPHVDSGEMPTPAGNEVDLHVDSGDISVPAGNCSKENAGDSIIIPDTSQSGEDHNSSRGSGDINPRVADVSHDKTSFQEIENGSLQLQQLPDSGVQDKDGQADPEINIDNLQPLLAAQVSQITPEDSSPVPHDEQPVPESQLIDESQSDFPTLNRLLVDQSIEPAVNEPTITVPQSGENLEQNSLVAAETPYEEHQPHLASSDAPAPPVNPLDMFDNINHMGSWMPNTDPLQAEVERLHLVNHNVINFHEENKRRLKSECDKEIAEMIAQIRSKYEAKHQEAVVAFHSKRKELDTNLNRVLMNKILAEAFRSKCQDLHSFRHAGTQQVSQAGLMQELHSLSGPSFMRRSTSPGQTSGSRQTTPPPLPQPQPQPQPQPTPTSVPQQLQPPLQIVHQPAALFSNIPSRLPPSSNLQSPSITPIIPPPNFTTSRPPPTINLVSPSTAPRTTRAPPTVIPITPSTTPTASRPPPTVNPITPSTAPTTSRPPSGINPITPSTAPTTSRSPPVNPINPSSAPGTSRPPPTVNPITPSTAPTTSRLPPGINPIATSRMLNHPPSGVNSISPSGTQNRSPFIVNHTDMSAANLRINTETCRQASHIRPVANSEAHAPSPHIQSVANGQTHAPAPHIQPVANGDNRAPALHIRPAANGDTDTHMRALVRHEIRPLAPHTQSGITSEIRATAPQTRPFGNSEIRAPAPHMRSMVSNDIRTLAPHIRSMVRSDIRSPAPHMRSMVNSEIRGPAPHMRSAATYEIRAPAPHMQPFRSTPSVPPDFTTHRSMLPSQHVTSSLPLTSNSQLPLSTSSSQPLLPIQPEASVVPATSASPDNSLTTVPDLASQLDFLHVTDYNVEGGGAPSSPGPRLVCLSDDD